MTQPLVVDLPPGHPTDDYFDPFAAYDEMVRRRREDTPEETDDVDE